MSKKSKVISGPDFSGKDLLEFIDVQDWVVSGWGESSKSTLDDLEWMETL